ncbi:hypothetical protein BJX70DRAFT_400422 [Aspergillus crustosus]
MEQYLIQKINANSSKIFKANGNRPQLEISSIEERPEGAATWSLHRKEIVYVREREEAQTTNYSECGRIYTIRHARSWAPLDISRELFDRLLDTHQVFPALWRVILTFGLKRCENEYGFPTPQGKESRSNLAEIQEMAYVIRRVERNNRVSQDYPWSIRQTGVYQKLVQPDDRSQDPSAVFFLVAPSSAAEKSILPGLDDAASDLPGAVRLAFKVHKGLVAESLMGWADYMCWLEDELRTRSTRMCAKPLLNVREEISMKFIEDDRQYLKQLEDYITDLQVILHTKVLVVQRLKTNCERLCSKGCVNTGDCGCHRAIHWFEDHVVEAQSYQERAKLLQAQAQSVQSLVSDLLIRELTVRSARDAISVKLMALIGLVFLPTTLIANLFSTQFVNTEGGKMHVSKDFWLIVCLGLPITGIVFVIWLFWVRYECARLQPRPSAKVMVEEPCEDAEVELRSRITRSLTWIGTRSWGASWGAPGRESSLPIQEDAPSFNPRP